MSQITLGSLTTLNLSTHLDPMFTDLYSVWNGFSISDPTKPGAGSGGWLGFGAYQTGGVWKNSVAGYGGVALRNNSDSLQFMAGETSGGAGTTIGAFAECGRIVLDGRLIWGSAPNDWTVNARATIYSNYSNGISLNLHCAHNSSGSAGIARVDYTSARLWAFYYGTTAVGYITTNGTTTSYATSSDARLKTNVADATVDSGAVIDAIQVRRFDWISDNSHTRAGFVAQELAAVAPEAVRTGDAGTDPYAEGATIWGVDPGKLLPIVIKELQAVRARLAALEAA